MADLTVQSPALTGATPTFNTCANGGDTFTNNGRTLVIFYNSHASASRTVTFDARPTTVEKEGFGTLPVADTTLVVPAQTYKVIGPFPTSRFNNSSEKVSQTYDSEANLTAAVVSV